LELVVWGGVEESRSRGVEEWRSRGVEEWRSGGVEESRSGGVEESRSGGVEEWRSRGVLHVAWSIQEGVIGLWDEKGGRYGIVVKGKC
jgi:hypothetical protein